MAKRLRVYAMRVIIALIVVFMVAGLASNLLRFGQSEDEPEIVEETKKSKYSYVDEDTKLHLDGLDADILMPEGATVQDEQVDEETNAIVKNYGVIDINDDMSVQIGVQIMEANQGFDFGDASLGSLDALIEQTKEAEYTDTNYITFQGQQNLYLVTNQKIPDSVSEYSYEITYTIYDVDNQNVYMILLRLITPTPSTKNDRILLDQMGKEMLTQIDLSKSDIVDAFGLPADKEDEFNHVIGK